MPKRSGSGKSERETARATQARNKSTVAIPPQGKRNLAAIAKALRQLKREAEAKGIKLAEADEKSWAGK